MVVDRPALSKSNKVIYCTISPWPKAKCETLLITDKSIKKVQMKYESMDKKDQYDACMHILTSAYLPFLSDETELVGVAEMNKSGHVHFHFIFYDPEIQNDYDLNCFRATVRNRPSVISQRKKIDDTDYCNNIVWCTDLDETLLYLSKDNIQALKHFPNYVLGSISCDAAELPPTLVRKKTNAEHKIRRRAPSGASFLTSSTKRHLE